MSHETLQKGIFEGLESNLGKEFAKLSIDDQQKIADAVSEIAGDGPGVCDFVPEEQSGAFVEHLRNYMSVEDETDPTGLKADSAAAIKRILTSI